MEYPDILFVREEPMYDRWQFEPIPTHLVGKNDLESAVPDNDKENIVAVYKLISVGKYKKTVTTTSVVEKV